MIICKIYEMNCFVVNHENNDAFEHVLSILMVPVKAYDESSNTYTIHVTYKLWSYIQRECKFRNVTVLVPDKRKVVNMEEYRAYKAEQKADKQ